MIDGRRGSYSSKVNCPDIGYEEIYVWKDRHPDVCAMVETLVDEGKVGNSTGIMPLMSIL